MLCCRQGAMKCGLSAVCLVYDSWRGTKCGLALQKHGKSGDMCLVIWQVLAACAAVGISAGLIVAVLVMPPTGFDCDLCVKASCHNMLGWQCARSVNPKGYCRLLVFPDSTGRLVCPSDTEVDLGSVQTPLQGFNDLCAQRCNPGKS
jgi:hypothetical protein